MSVIIKETCCCGAEFSVSGDSYSACFRYSSFLDAHKACRDKKNNTTATNQPAQPTIAGQDIP